MAQKRMFTMKIVDSDAFLDMPLSTQCLYFHLNMRADDDGFVGNPKRIQRTIGAADDDLKLLIAKRFVLVFENGVIVIKHWRMHNTLQSDRYASTVYTEEKNKLAMKPNKSYTFKEDEDPPVLQIEQAEKPAGKKFVPPTEAEVREYCEQRNNGVDASAFVNFYESKGWMIGKNKMKDWKAAVRTWERNRKNTGGDKIANRVSEVDGW